MTKEDQCLNKLSNILIEINATYSATNEEKKILKKLFKNCNDLIKEHYKEVLQ